MNSPEFDAIRIGMASPAPWKLLTALWTVYLVWGSTYVAIKLSVRTLPALLSAGSRFLLAGGLLAFGLYAGGLMALRRLVTPSAGTVSNAQA